MTFKTFIATAAATVAFATNAFANDVQVTDVWARASAGMAAAGAAFMTINNGGADDTLISAQSDVAKRTELHTHIMDNGVMQMREVESGINLPAGETVMLQPGGYHVMFMGLNAPFKEGDTFALTLTFKSGQEITVDVNVMGPGAMGAGMGHGKMGNGNMGNGNMGAGMGHGNMPMNTGN